MVRAVVLAIVGVLAGAGRAQAVHYYGAGAASCIDMTNHRAMANNGNDPAGLVFLDAEWVLGFISAMSLRDNVDGFGGCSSSLALGQVEALCVLHPDWGTAMAAIAAFNKLGNPPSQMQLK